MDWTRPVTSKTQTGFAGSRRDTTAAAAIARRPRSQWDGMGVLFLAWLCDDVFEGGFGFPRDRDMCRGPVVVVLCKVHYVLRRNTCVCVIGMLLLAQSVREEWQRREPWTYVMLFLQVLNTMPGRLA